MAGEAAEDASRGKSASGKNSFSHFAGGTVMTEKDDTLLCEHGVDENEDGMGEGAAGGQVCVEHERLRAGSMWS